MYMNQNCLKKRREIHEEIAKSLRIFISGHESGQDEKRKFLNSYALAYLWAPDAVVELLNEFLRLQISYKANTEEISQEKMKKTYVQCILEMRKTAGFPDTKIEEDKYQFVTF